MASSNRPGVGIELVDLVKEYPGGMQAVAGVSFRIEPGEFFTLLGPSGSGKTTTLMMLVGLIPPTSGQIVIGDRDVSRLPPERRNIGVVFQNYALFPHMTVEDNLAFPLQLRRRPKDEIKRLVPEALKMVRLAGYERRYPKQLSGGQQQRVALARALIFRPPVLLMDEPLGALDRRLREEMQYELRSVHQQVGVTVVYVTHDQQEALTLSDRIAIMSEGRVVQIASPRAIYERPKSRFVASFFGDCNFLRGHTSGAGVQLDSGETLRILPPEGPRDGALAIAIRPEHIHLGDAPADVVTNELVGRVNDVTFLGDAVRVTFESAKSTKLLLKIPAPDYHPGLAHAGKVWWRADAATVVDDQ